MNNTFNFSRFVRLYQKHTVEHLKSYLLSIAVLAGLLLVCLGFVWYMNNARLSMRDQTSVFIFFYLGCGVVFTSLTFSHLGKKKEAIPALTLPVSHLEKYLVSFIYTFVVYQMIFTGIYFLVDGVLIAIGKPVIKGESEMINVFDLDQKIYIAFVIYAVLHAFAFCGAVYFEKLHFIKTAFTVLVFAFVLVIINNLLINSIIKGHSSKGIPFLGTSLIEHDNYYKIQLHGQGFAACVAAALIVTTVLLWATAYFKLKEKEV